MELAGKQGLGGQQILKVALVERQVLALAPACPVDVVIGVMQVVGARPALEVVNDPLGKWRSFYD